MLDAIYRAIGKFLGLIDGAMGSYVIALFIFAIIIELLMLPFGIKQQKNSIKQAKLRPKEMAIRKKYAGRNDQATQQKVSQEIQELYQKEGFNPMSGCLPLLIQLPIILILYQIVINPLAYVVGMSEEAVLGLTQFVNATAEAGGLGEAIAANSRGTIELINVITEHGLAAFEGLKTFAFTDLAISGEAIYTELASAVSIGLPDFNFLGLNLALVPSLSKPDWNWLIPVITFGVYFGSMKLNRKLTFQPQMAANDAQQGCSNNIMDISMPLMSVYITFVVPGAIGVYWIFKSLLSTLKQFVMSKVLPLPRFTEEDYKAAEKEMKAKSKGERRTYVNTTGVKPRSLHHIDDEDYETPVEQPKQKKKSAEEAPKEGIASLIDAAPVKKDEGIDKVAEEMESEKTENVAESAETADAETQKENND